MAHVSFNKRHSWLESMSRQPAPPIFSSREKGWDLDGHISGCSSIAWLNPLWSHLGVCHHRRSRTPHPSGPPGGKFHTLSKHVERGPLPEGLSITPSIARTVIITTRPDPHPWTYIQLLGLIQRGVKSFLICSFLLLMTGSQIPLAETQCKHSWVAGIVAELPGLRWGRGRGPPPAARRHTTPTLWHIKSHALAQVATHRLSVNHLSLHRGTVLGSNALLAHWCTQCILWGADHGSRLAGPMPCGNCPLDENYTTCVPRYRHSIWRLTGTSVLAWGYLSSCQLYPSLSPPLLNPRMTRPWLRLRAIDYHQQATADFPPANTHTHSLIPENINITTKYFK